MAALTQDVGWRRGRRRISGKRLHSIETLRSEGMSNRAIAHRLGVSENAIRKLAGPSQPIRAAQLSFAAKAEHLMPPPPPVVFVDDGRAAASNADGCDPPVTSVNDDEPVPLSLDHDPSDRSFDRQLAHLGLLDDAAPLFRDGRVAGLGVLVAVPCLIESGLSDQPQALR